MRQIWTLLLLLLAVLITRVHPLTCYICGDNNLDEFGECSTQFQYDCGNYAARFAATERIYCRTTRQRAKNNTFTIMKECISEQDHYRTFPEKGYRLDEECDLVDIRGEEVAYCLCRSDYCNRQPVAEQFMAFEEKHPELFGEEKKLPEVPLKIQQLSAPSPPPPPPIIPEIRRSQLPARAAGIETEISAIPRNLPRTSSSHESAMLPDLAMSPISEGSFVGSGDFSSSSSSRVMKCVQCGDGNLRTSLEECKRQVVVECPSERAMCFTRQINIGNGLYGMEKMCVLPEQLVNEFGEAAKEQGCGSSNGGRVQYCACKSPSCNQIPLSQQMQMFNINAPSNSPNVPILSPAELPPVPPASAPVPPPQPIIPVITHTAAGQPARSVEPPAAVVATPATSSSSRGELRCATCSETDMADPTADCRGMNEQICERKAMYCVTKQTQISTSSFAIEKKCLTPRESQKFLPGEKFEEGCATTEGGMVNYCICSGDLCNRQSLLQQAQMTGVRDELEEQRHVEEEQNMLIQVPRVPAQHNVGLVAPAPPPAPAPSPRLLPPVIIDEDDDQSPDQKLEIARDEAKSEDEIIRERQREWAKEAAVSRATRPTFFACFIFAIFQHFFG